MKKIFLVITLFVNISAISQTTFFKIYGDMVSEHNDFGFSVLQTDNGDYVASGVIGSFSNYTPPWVLEGDVYLLRTDENGDTLWTKRYGKPNSREIAYSMCAANDGGFMLSAYRNEHLWLIRTDSKGDSLWTKSYPVGIGHSIERTNDNEYVITGTNPGIYLLKINSEGDIIWLKTYDGLEGRSVQQTSDSGYIIAGFKGISDGILIIKTDLQGDTLWTKTYSYNGKPNEPFSICQTNDGGYFLTGTYTSQNCDSCEANYRTWILKTDVRGDTIWTKKIAFSTWELASKGIENRNGNFIIVGQAIETDYHIYIAELDTLGNIIWFNKVLGEKYAGSAAYDVKETLDGGYIITGRTGSDLCLVKSNENGKVTDVKYNNNKIPNDYVLLQNYPNPFNPTTQIQFQIPKRGLVTIKIYDILGNEIIELLNEEKVEGSYTISWDGKDKNNRTVSSGIYLYCLKANSIYLSKKMALIR